jgi:hypothetical protein
MQIPRNRPSAGQCGLPERIRVSRRVITARTSMLRCIFLALAAAVVLRAAPCNPIKQGVELVRGFQFHLPPVFRPSRSASLAVPRQRGVRTTEQPMTQPNPDAAHEPLHLLADWISREQLACELGLTSDTLARWEARRQGPPCTRIGRKTLYRRVSVQDWIRAQEQVHPVRKSRVRS